MRENCFSGLGQRFSFFSSLNSRRGGGFRTSKFFQINTHFGFFIFPLAGGTKKRYTFAYLESVASGVKKGDTLLQLGVGGGMKASAAVWKALRHVEDTHPAWAHLDRIPVTQRDLPRLIDEGDAEVCAAHEAKVCAEAEALRAARKAAAAAAAESATTTLASRADSAGERELERAVPTDVKGGVAVGELLEGAAVAEA